MMSGVRVNDNAMRSATMKGFATATDLADYLTKKGLPFRDSHEVVAKAVQFAEQKGCDLSDLELAELKMFSMLIEDDIFAILTLEGAMMSRDHTGGTSPKQVMAAIERAKKSLA